MPKAIANPRHSAVGFVLRAVLSEIVLLALFFSFHAWLIVRFGLSHSTIPLLAFLAVAIAAGITAFFSSFQLKKQGIVNGCVIGGINAAVLVVIAAVSGQWTALRLCAAVVTVLFCIVCGYCGMTRSEKRKKRHK